MITQELNRLYTLLHNEKLEELINALASTPKNKDHQYLLGSAHQKLFEFDKAIEIFSKIVDEVPYKSKYKYLKRKRDCHLSNQNWEEALIEAKAMAKMGDFESLEDCQKLSIIYSVVEKYSWASELVQKCIQNWLDQSKRNHKKGPAIFVISPPLSGGIALANSISAATGFPKLNILCRPSSSKFHGFGSGYLIKKALKKINSVGIINHSHLEASKTNLSTIKESRFIKIILHLRNPINILIALKNEMNYGLYSIWLHKVEPSLLTMNHNEQINWLIKFYLPYLINWIKKWTSEFENENKSIVRITEFEQFNESNLDKVAREISRELTKVRLHKFITPQFKSSPNKKKFRREDLTEAQLTRIKNKIPSSLMSKFNWT